MSQTKSINKTYLTDSLSTVSLLNILTLCEVIKYAEENIDDIIKSKGFSGLILMKIANEAKTIIDLKVINGNMVMTNDWLKEDLTEQLSEIKLRQKCFDY